MKKHLVVLIILIICVLVSTSVEAQHDRYFFKNTEGRAVLSRTGGSTWLVLQQVQPVELKAGDMVRVEGDGRGELRFPDGTIARLKNNAMITLMRYGINLKFGYAWLNVRRSSDIFKVTTPLGSCSVLGTSFDVDVDRFGKSRVRVFSGIVAVRASSDSRNRQLILQPGMHTRITENTRVADKPEKFQASTIETSLISEWENRNFPEASLPPALQPAVPSVDTSMQPSVVPSMPSDTAPVGTVLPPMRPELEAELDLPPAEAVVEEVSAESVEDTERKVVVRQRSEFLEMLRRQQLAKDSVIGKSFDEKEAMIEDQHASELGQYNRSMTNISDGSSIDREFSLLRNRLLRVQSQIRQVELEMTSMVNQNIQTSAQRRKIATLQSQILELQSEQRILSTRLRDVQTRKR